MVVKRTAVQQSGSGASTGSSGGAAPAGGGARASGGGPGEGAGGKKGARTTGAAGRAGKEEAAGKAGEKVTGEEAGRAPVKKAPGRKAARAKGAAGAGGSGAATDAAGSGAGRKSTAKKAGAAQAAEQTGATTVVAKKTPGTATAAKSAVPKARGAAAEPGDLAVRPGEDPWTPEEMEEARDELLSEQTRLRAEIASSEQALAGLMRDSGDGAGDDQADTGTKNITREHELALAANAREMLTQTERALERLDTGTYGLCENCGNPIGKARMQAFPRATLCVECKQKQERRY
ncbi:RNA polymerase-binding transcription factor DksA [Streptomyces sp. enrichment culture]|uniref:TraR/DksA family transcriptional regulator n=1 Tax=Streptomyces sp. enrichment culture TaxID=1795815 RepID=UPI003F56446A